MVHKNIFNSRDEWLEARKNYIGGSDASAILGLNPWKSNIELWEEKTGLREPKSIDDLVYVQYGTKAEELLRELFKLDYPKYKVIYEPNNSYMNDKYEFARASLDGLILTPEGKKGILEIKTTSATNYLKWKDKIPDNYYIQVLWYLGILEADFAIVKCQMKHQDTSSTIRHYRFERENVEDDIKYLFEEAGKFWEFVKSGERPALKLPNI